MKENKSLFLKGGFCMVPKPALDAGKIRLADKLPASILFWRIGSVPKEINFDFEYYTRPTIRC